MDRSIIAALFFVQLAFVRPSEAGPIPPALEAAITAVHHRVDWSTAGFTSSNREHGLGILFDQRGPALQTGGQSVQLHLAGYGRGAELITPASGIMTAKANRIDYRRGALTEWYVNDARGLEQGFTLGARPPGRGDLALSLAVKGARPRLLNGTDEILLDLNGGSSLRYRGLKAWDAGGRSLPVRMEVVDSLVRLITDDRDAVYPVTIDPWIQQATLTLSDSIPSDYFGGAVAISGDTAIVGAPGKNGNAGEAHIFVKTGGTWSEQATLTPPVPSSTQQFGLRVAISGDTALVNERYSVHVYVRTGTSWTKQATLTSPTSADLFGTEISIDGDTALIGAYGKDDWTGGAYVFTRVGSSWSLQATLLASDRQHFDHFGSSVALSDDTALIGAYFANGLTGAAYVFTRSGSVWSQQAKLTSVDAPGGGGFGENVALSGDTALVGNLWNAGANKAYVFQRYGTSWTQQAVLTASDQQNLRTFGSNVSLGNHAAWVLADKDDGTILIYVFERLGTQWIAKGKLMPADPQPTDAFMGTFVLSGDTGLAGAFLNGGALNAVYVFQTPCTVSLNLSYQGGALGVGYSIRNNEPVRWTGRLIHAGGTRALWSKGLPVIEQPRTGSFAIPDFPPSGYVGVLSTMSTAGGPQCTELTLINTGGSGLTADEVQSRAGSLR